MDRSLPTSPDPGAWHPNAVAPPDKDRRQSVRQKLHSPVYASFNRPQTGIVVDLSELLDLNEGGFAVQTGEPMEINRAVTLCLELPETNSYVHWPGHMERRHRPGRYPIFRTSGEFATSTQRMAFCEFTDWLLQPRSSNRTKSQARTGTGATARRKLARSGRRH